MLKSVRIKSFHSAPLLFARKSGASALDLPPRKFSKKQMKRKKKERERNSAIIDPAKEKIKIGHLKNNLSSPEMIKYIKETTESLDQALKDVMRPDGVILKNLENEKDTLPKVIDPNYVLQELKKANNQKLNEQKVISTNLNKSVTSVNENSITLIPTSKITIAMIASSITELLKKEKVGHVDEILSIMKKLEIKPNHDIYYNLIKHSNNNNTFHKTMLFFDEMMEVYDITPEQTIWSEIIYAKSNLYGVEEGLQIIERLKKNSIKITSAMFCSVLKVYLKLKKYDEFFDLWISLHSEPVELDNEAFQLVLQCCSHTSQSEKAFFLIDEMKSLSIRPTEETLVQFLRAVATSPFWVNGYQNSVTDALCVVEGFEQLPSVSLYNAVLFGYGKARDPAAAEYYFWEMRQKGLRQTTATYQHLFSALANAQSVGAKYYGAQGRFVRPPDRPATEDELAYKKIGATAATRLMTEGIWNEPLRDSRGEKRSKVPMRWGDGAEEAELSDALRLEAALLPDAEPAADGALSAGEAEALVRDADEPWEFSDPYPHLRQRERLPQPDSAMTAEMLTLLDGGAITARDTAALSFSENSIEENWALVEFGRPPDPDYSAPLVQRQKQNMQRAELTFSDMLAMGLKPDVFVLTSYMAVFAEAQRIQPTLQAFALFDKYGVVPNAKTYRVLIRMFVRCKELDKAMEIKECMGKEGLIPDGLTYGLLIETHSHRNLIVEGLKLVEEVQRVGVRVPERHLRHLRSRCKRLGVTPYGFPEDPTAWAKELKQMRRQRKGAKDRVGQPVRSAMFK